jgi:hypothetical protein
MIPPANKRIAIPDIRFFIIDSLVVQSVEEGEFNLKR